MIVTVKNEVNEPEVRLRAHRNKGSREPSSGSTRDKTKIVFFRAGNLGYTNNRSPLSSTHRSFRLQFARRMEVQTDTLQWRHIYCSLYIYYQHRTARATLECARARAWSHERAAELGTFVSVFFFRLYTKLKHDHNRTTIHDFNFHQ